MAGEQHFKRRNPERNVLKKKPTYEEDSSSEIESYDQVVAARPKKKRMNASKKRPITEPKPLLLAEETAHEIPNDHDQTAVKLMLNGTACNEEKKIIVYRRRRLKLNPSVVQLGADGRDSLPLDDKKIQDGVRLSRPNKSDAVHVSDQAAAARPTKAKNASMKIPRNEVKPPKPLTSEQLKACEIRAKLDDADRTTVILMKKSHVSKGFWLNVPAEFCRSAELPEVPETNFTLVSNEDGEEFTAKFIGPRNGLSGGWMGFAKGQKLKKGDVVVFHLVEPTARIMKVYIVRAPKQESDDADEKESQEVRARKINAQLRIMKREREIIRQRNDANWRNREMYMRILQSRSSHVVKSDLAASSTSGLSEMEQK